MTKKVIAVVLVLGILFSNGGVFAENSNVLYTCLKAEEEAQIAKMIKEKASESDINYVRGSADYTWSVYQETMNARRQEYIKQIEITPVLEQEIQNKLVSNYKSTGSVPLIHDYGFKVRDDKFFREDVFDAVYEVLGDAIGKQQQSLKQDYRIPSSKYYWETAAKLEWDSAGVRGDLIVVKSNSKFGLMDLSGKKVIDAKFDKIYVTDKYSALCQRKKNSTTNEFVGLDGKVVFTLPAEYKIDNFYKGQAIVYTVGRIESSGRQFHSTAGVIDTKGKFIIPMNYYSIKGVLTNKNTFLYHAVKLEGKNYSSSFLDAGGKAVVTCNYKILILKTEKWDTDPFSGMSVAVLDDDMFIAEKNNKFGCVDLSGKELVPFIYDDMKGIVNRAAFVKKSGKYGVVDKTGKVIVPLLYDDVDLQNGMYIVELNGKNGLFNTQGKLIANPEWDVIYYGNSEVANVCRNGKWGCVNNTTGKLVIPAVYDKALPFFEGIAKIVKDGKAGFVTSDGKVISEPQWDPLIDGNYYNGLIKVYKNKKVGFLDRTGKVVIQPEWDDAGVFDKDGLVNVRKLNWSGIIDSSGKVVLSTDDMKAALVKLGMAAHEDMNFMSTFQEGLALAMIRGKFYYVDKSGNIPFVGNYTLASPFENGYARVYDGKTYDRSSSIMMGSEDDNPNKTYKGVYEIPKRRWNSQGGCYHIIDKEGNIILSYPKQLTMPTRVKDIQSNDLQIGIDPSWNSNREFPLNLAKHVVYNDKEGIIVLKKK